MKIIRRDPNPSGAYPAIQSWNNPQIPDGFALWPDSLDPADFYAHNGFATMTVEQVDGVATVTACTPNAEAWAAWMEEHPVPDPLEENKAAKLAELSAECNKAIVSGCDIILSDESEGHISLTNEDQINLTNAYASVSAGAAEYPYHLDGELCAMYSAADIAIMAQAATTYKLYHTTYYNHLKAWIERCETVEEVEAIVYGSELPEDLAANMTAILEASNA